MAKVRTTVILDEDVLRAVRAEAARTERDESDVIEDALRRHLGLGLIVRIWDGADLSESAADELAVDAQHATRRRSG